MRKKLNSKTLLPVLIILGIMVVFVHLDGIIDSVKTGKFFTPVAFAETSPPQSITGATKDAAPTLPSQGNENKPIPESQNNTPHYNSDEQDSSSAEMEVLNQLSKRREELDKRNKELDTREDLIKVAEQRVDQKIKEMETLRQQLQSMVNQVSEAQATQIENLVKIYETMKPDEAARIFETLDMPVLLGVIQHMKPVRTAPILAKMAPEKAKEVTVALTKQDQLPQLK